MPARRVLSALILSLVCSAIFTVWLGRTYFKSKATAPTQQKYVGAVANLEPGQVLVAANLKIVDWPANVPLQAPFVKPEDVVGRTLLYPLAAGQPVLERDLSAIGAGAGLSTRIPDGMRAISLRTDQIVGVAGFLLPGTRVDVLVTYHTLTNQQPVTSTVLQDAQILAAGQKMQADPDGKPNTTDVVTLLVSPNDAERVVLASAQGTVHFVLRNGQDHLQVDDAPAQISELGGIGNMSRVPAQAAPVAPRPRVVAQVVAAAPKPYSVQTISGGKSTTETFQ
jgi:pilus assembly protein CpaB